ncbi:MAG: PaaI family thioesterase [Acidobacteria bacterium]|nr:PaaI family thioesterase [Acidobacteriota bacterium]
MPGKRKGYPELRRRFERVGAVRLLGMKVSRLRPGRATLTLDTRPQHSHPHGIHGGVLAALADTALAMAIFTRLPPATPIATVEMKINYLWRHVRGRLRADARVLRLGKRLAVGEVEIRNSSGRLIAKSLLTYSVAAD